MKGLWNGALATGRLLAPPARRLLLLDHQVRDARVELGDDVALLDEEALRRRDVHGAVGADGRVLAARAPYREAERLADLRVASVFGSPAGERSPAVRRVDGWRQCWSRVDGVQTSRG